MRGFTLAEIIIAVAILVLLATLVIGNLGPFRDRTNLNSAAEDGVSLLNEARSRTLSSQGGSQYSVRFETNKMILFTGATYNAGAPDNNESPLPAAIEISSISLNGGGVAVTFNRLTGATANYGTITFRLIHDTSQTRVVTINSAGNISL